MKEILLQQGALDEYTVLALLRQFDRGDVSKDEKRCIDRADASEFGQAARAVKPDVAATVVHSERVFRPRIATRVMGRVKSEVIPMRPDPASDSGRSDRMLAEVSARSFWLSIPSWIGRLLSRSYRGITRSTRSASRVSCERLESPADWSTRGSCRFTAWAGIRMAARIMRCV